MATVEEYSQNLLAQVRDMSPEQVQLNRETYKEELSKLNVADKRLIKLYMQSPIEDLVDKGIKYNNSNASDADHQYQLYNLASKLKAFNISVNGGKSRRTYRRRRIIKKKLTRRR